MNFINRILFTISIAVCACLVQAQTVIVTNSLTLIEASSVMASYSNLFGYLNNPELDNPFPYAVIRIDLVGDVREAKMRLGLYLGTMLTVEAVNKDIENTILFVVPKSAKNIYLTCGDGCEKQTLYQGSLRSNKIYTCRVEYQKRQENTMSDASMQVLQEIQSLKEQLAQMQGQTPIQSQSSQIQGENHSSGSSANATTHLSQSNNTRKVGTLIYAQSKEINQYCDGKYSDKKEYFSADLDNLNREHFRITFVFKAFSYKGTLDWTSEQYPLMLSEGWRVLGVCLHEDGSIYITTNNGDHSYKTNLTYTPNEYRKMDIEYDHGKLYVNENVYDVEMNEYNGDNTLSSIDYSSGNAFLGYINSVRVYNIDD